MCLSEEVAYKEIITCKDSGDLGTVLNELNWENGVKKWCKF
jgi:hypothetical protein